MISPDRLGSAPVDTEKLHRGWYHPRALPHFDSPERVQFVTVRLIDSLPSDQPIREELPHQKRRRLEADLDKGLGVCWLARDDVVILVRDTLLHFDQQRYLMLAWCIMPNHIHCLFEPMERYLLADIVKSWKTYSANSANRLLGRSGPFWQRDYFDRYMRSEEQLAKTINYIEQNPVLAGLCNDAATWRWSSAAGHSGVISRKPTSLK
ncbi:transposase [Labrys sp. KNU-23]|nr:transposase [Labrys sp. KNU-23]